MVTWGRGGPSAHTVQTHLHVVDRPGMWGPKLQRSLERGGLGQLKKKSLSGQPGTVRSHVWELSDSVRPRAAGAGSAPRPPFAESVDRVRSHRAQCARGSPCGAAVPALRVLSRYVRAASQTPAGTAHPAPPTGHSGGDADPGAELRLKPGRAGRRHCPARLRPNPGAPTPPCVPSASAGGTEGSPALAATLTLPRFPPESSAGVPPGPAGLGRWAGGGLFSWPLCDAPSRRSPESRFSASPPHGVTRSSFRGTALFPCWTPREPGQPRCAGPGTGPPRLRGRGHTQAGRSLLPG